MYFWCLIGNISTGQNIKNYADQSYIQALFNKKPEI